MSITGDSNKSGIPKAIFIEDVDEFMKQSGDKSVEVILQMLEEQHSKYKYLESNLVTKKNRLKAQLPDLRTSLNVIRHLVAHNDNQILETNYQLCETLYAKAKIPPTDKVCLWLGANVMLEYNLSEAELLLKRNEENCGKSVNQVDEDLGFLRDQTTTVEVNMARIYNWDVKKRQALKAVKT